MLDSEIYVKTDTGRDEIRSRGRGLPMSVRAILLMVDGQRTVAAMRTLIAGSKAPATVLDDLVTQGLIEARPVALGDAAATVAPPQQPTPTVAAASEPLAARLPPTFVSAPMPAIVAATIATPAPAPAAPVATARPAGTVGAAVRTLETGAPGLARTLSEPSPLDLVLPTIHGPDPTGPDDAPNVQLTGTPVVANSVPPDAYEHLYAMMNEIVRDFLAPHRRYFFQLKIERCGTAEELLELLHGLQTALAKSRGEAFASDVIARLRSATV